MTEAPPANPPPRPVRLRDRFAVALMLVGVLCWLVAIVLLQPFQRIQADPDVLPYGALWGGLGLFAVGFLLAYIGYRLGPGSRPKP